VPSPPSLLPEVLLSPGPGATHLPQRRRDLPLSRFSPLSRFIIYLLRALRVSGKKLKPRKRGCWAWREGCAEGEGERIQADSALSTEPHAGLDLMTLRSRPQPKPRVGHSTDCTTQAPQGSHFYTHAFATHIFTERGISKSFPYKYTPLSPTHTTHEW